MAIGKYRINEIAEPCASVLDMLSLGYVEQFPYVSRERIRMRVFTDLYGCGGHTYQKQCWLSFMQWLRMQSSAATDDWSRMQDGASSVITMWCQ